MLDSAAPLQGQNEVFNPMPCFYSIAVDRRADWGRHFIPRGSRQPAFWVLLGLWMVLHTAAANVRAQPGPVVWVAPALTRIGLSDTPGNSREIVLWAARGEYESFHIVVRAPAGGLKNVRVEASDLTGSGNQRISNSNVTFYQEHYVKVMQGSPDRGGGNRPLGPGWYPDALIPLKGTATARQSTRQPGNSQFSVEQAGNQPIWVDILVPRTAEPGRYSGTVTTTTEQGKVSVSIVLNIWNFELPLRPSLLSSFGIYNDTSSTPHVFYSEDKSNQQLLLEHKIMPVSVQPEYEREFLAQYGLSLSQLGYFRYATYGNCNQPPAPAVSELLSRKARHQPNLPLYVHLADEVSDCPNIFPVLKEWARNVHQAGMTTLLTAIPLPQLRGDGSGTGRSVADIWVVLPKQFASNSADIAAAMKKGDKVWAYTALVQDAYSPKWEIDFSPMNYRIYGFLNQSMGLTGLLYWSVNSWAVNPTKDPWNNFVYVENGHATPPGEGWLVYPGDNGFVPSLRLKWIRKGIEDYEYVEMLKKLHRGDWALGVIKNVAADWTHWSQSPDAVESVRRQLGAEINRFSAPPSTVGKSASSSKE